MERHARWQTVPFRGLDGATLGSVQRRAELAGRAKEIKPATIG
jgi:hypothetical protein